MRDVLERVLDRMREGVHRIDAPAVAGVVVGRAADAVERRVAQVDVRARHVDLRAQHRGAVGVLAVPHLAQARQVLVRRAVAERAVACRASRSRRGWRASRRRSARRRRRGRPDQRLGGAVHEVEVVAGEVEVARRAPPSAGSGACQSKPSQCTASMMRVDVLLLFLLRVGVVEAQVADAAVVARQAEVQADALGVADVQVAVRLGRKARADARRIGRRARRGGRRRPGVPPKRRPAYVPSSRSRSMTWRRKLLPGAAASLGWLMGSQVASGDSRRLARSPPPGREPRLFTFAQRRHRQRRAAARALSTACTQACVRRWRQGPCNARSFSPPRRPRPLLDAGAAQRGPASTGRSASACRRSSLFVGRLGLLRRGAVVLRRARYPAAPYYPPRVVYAPRPRIWLPPPPPLPRLLACRPRLARRRLARRWMARPRRSPRPRRRRSPRRPRRLAPLAPSGAAPLHRLEADARAGG